MAIASSTTSTRKSSHNHHHNRSRPPYSPSIKSDAVSYIYDQNSNRSTSALAANANAGGSATAANRSHTSVAKQDSNMSTQMLLKQDSTASSSTICTTTTTSSSTPRQQHLLKQDSEGSRQMLIKQESIDGSGSSGCVSRQESSASLVGALLPGAVVVAGRPAHQLRHQDSASSGSKHAMLSKQDSVVSYIETKRGQLMRQDSDLASRRREAATPLAGDGGVGGISGVVGSGGSARKALCRQDSVVSFAEPRGECENGMWSG